MNRNIDIFKWVKEDRVMLGIWIIWCPWHKSFLMGLGKWTLAIFGYHDTAKYLEIRKKIRGDDEPSQS